MFKSCFLQVKESILQKSIEGICGGIVYQLVGLEVGFPMLAVYGLLVIDMIVGTIAAIKNKSFSWRVWGSKFGAKVMVWSLLISTVHQLTIIEPKMIAFEGYTLLRLGLTDAYSIAQNARKISDAAPTALINGIKKVKDKADNLMTKS